MGLDNIPRQYPCKTQGTAVLVARKGRDGETILGDDGTPSLAISCEETQACGGCPYKNAYDKSGLAGGAVYGIFGTPCWYRGKYGNALLQEAGFYDDTDSLNFYGDNEDGTEKSPESCVTLADVIGELLDDTDPELSDEARADLKYAEWYLRWVAEECDGLVCWY